MQILVSQGFLKLQIMMLSVLEPNGEHKAMQKSMNQSDGVDLF
jgi:hypothetical protein